MSSPDDRLRRLEASIPTPATDPPFDPDVFTDAEIGVMEQIASNYPAGTFGRGGGIEALSDADLDVVTAIAVRVEARRAGGEEAAIETT